MTFQGDGCPPVQPSPRSRRRAASLVLPTAAALGAGAAIAYGAIPAADGTIGVCFVPDRNVFFTEDEAKCVAVEGQQFIKINQTGPQGPAGPAGPAGAPGAPGAPGSSGGLAQPVHPIPASDYLLEIEGVKGESKDDKHKGTIDIESFSWGATRSAKTRSSGAGGGAGKVQFQDFHFTKAVDKSSPLLFTRAATGQHIKKAVLFVRKAGGDQQEYYKITLTDILVSSIAQGPQTPGAGAGQLEEVSFNYSKIQFEYQPQKPDGSLDAPVKAGYDLKLNKKV